MNKKEKVCLLMLAVLAGWMGGTLTGHLSHGERALAQKAPEPPKAIVAQEVRIVDKDGKPRMYLAAPDGAPTLTLHDKDGKVRASLRLSPDGDPVLSFHDKEGKVIYRTVTFR